MDVTQHTTEGPSPVTDILAGTIAEMTWFQVEQAARDGAVVLWAFGVIEQHGPHLPTGTDVYLPSARLVEVQRELGRRGVPALVLPPFYWGVNVVSASFPASYSVRPSVIQELMSDVLLGLARDGFRHIFCFSGHGDALHNATVHGGARLGAERAGVDVSFVADAALATRLGLDLDDPHVTVSGPVAGHPSVERVVASSPSTPAGAPAPEGFVDVHAGRWESAQMLSARPDLVREESRVALPSTDLGPDALAVWRQGFDAARSTTPLGYFGDPAAATVDEGRASLRESAVEAAEAIVSRVERMRSSATAD